MKLTLREKAFADESFLLSVYASTRAAEMALVPWDETQKMMFLQAQFQAQQQHYQARYPNASLNVIKMGDEKVGRLYTAELDDEIRIIDVTVLPEYQKRGIGTKLIEDVLKTGAEKQKPVQIYIEDFNLSAKFFSRLGFTPVSEQGVHVLWRWANFVDNLK